jgi:hypothetical protein
MDEDEGNRTDSSGSTTTDDRRNCLGTSPRVLRPEVWHSWLEFVRWTRIQQGICRELQHRQNLSCDCWSSRASYPHWPPTTVAEAFEQLVLLQDEDNLHRPDLAPRWLYHVLSLAVEAAIGQTAEVVSNYFEIASGIRLLCPSLSH